MACATRPRRVWVERGIYMQPNGKYAVCVRRAGRLCYRAVGFDLALARTEREALIAAAENGALQRSRRLRFDTAAGWWIARFEAKVAVGERHPRTLESHRYHLQRHLLPALAGRRMCALSVDDVAALGASCAQRAARRRPAAGALATLHSIIRCARRYG